MKPGSVFAGYRVLSMLGRGGMGQVWLVEHPTLGRREALKIISPNPADPSFAERFRNEARTAAALDHPGIVTVYTHGVENGSPWFSMSYLEGEDLAAASALPVDDVVTVVGKAADALDYAHTRRVIHRDIKPANIVVARGPDGRIARVTVLDFGIARLMDGAKMTATNLFVGTLAYAAPEILTGEPAIPASDQYALACTTFQLLTGSQPYPGQTPMALIAGHVNTPAPRISERRPDLVHVDAVFARALAKNPSDRFASCSEFAAALARAVEIGSTAALRRRGAGTRPSVLTTTAAHPAGAGEPGGPPRSATRRSPTVPGVRSRRTAAGPTARICDRARRTPRPRPGITGNGLTHRVDRRRGTRRRRPRRRCRRRRDRPQRIGIRSRDGAGRRVIDDGAEQFRRILHRQR
ncbi:serine/threonine-protein kinase [Gordonia terrae]|uniref:serine/threonine-protein kinase n=1 Tax=Gordonia hongkongensis TaxID=1701090 RepID=UPI0022B5784A|nr:serine/threonine-protein kinase [Gordonia terrae]